jgi:NAD(P)H-hydrate epimerase
MDHAGKAVAEKARERLKKRSARIIVLSGGGNNGGDGVSAARWLKSWGFPVEVCWLKNPAEWTEDLAQQYRMAKRAGVTFRPFLKIPAKNRVSHLRRAAVLIDALLGTGIHGHLKVPMFDAIACANHSERPIIAVDIPSGLDADTGRVHDIAIKAGDTITMAAPKTGLLKSAARRYVGRLTVADIGLPL